MRRDRQGARERFRLTLRKRVKRQKRAAQREAFIERQKPREGIVKKRVMASLAARQQKNRERRERAMILRSGVAKAAR